MARLDQLRTAKNKEAFMKAYEACNGNMKLAARMVGISRKTPYNWIDRDPRFARKLKVRLEERNEAAHDQLMAAIARGHEPSVHFYLRNNHPAYMSTTRRFQYDQQVINFVRWQMSEVDSESRFIKCKDCGSKEIELCSWVGLWTPGGRKMRLKKYPPTKLAPRNVGKSV